jgi:hypothetical protein
MDGSILPFLFGLLAGALGGLMGVGGGLLLVPLLTHALHRPQHEAHGTSLTFIIATSLVATALYARQEHILPTLAALLALGAVPGVLLGARLARSLSARRLRQAFGLLLLATAIRILVLPPRPEAAGALWPPALEVVLGAVAGILAGLLGVGGGVIIVPVLVLAQRVEQHTAQGVSLLMILPTAVVGAMSHARHGHVATRLLPPLMLGGASGALGGAFLADRIDAYALSRLFALLLLPVSAQMIWSRPRRSATVPVARPPATGGST